MYIHTYVYTHTWVCFITIKFFKLWDRKCFLELFKLIKSLKTLAPRVLNCLLLCVHHGGNSCLLSEAGAQVRAMGPARSPSCRSCRVSGLVAESGACFSFSPRVTCSLKPWWERWRARCANSSSRVSAWQLWDVFCYLSRWDFAFSMSVMTKENSSKALSCCRHVSFTNGHR